MVTHRRHDLDAISLDLLRRYLRLNGWKRAGKEDWAPIALPKSFASSFMRERTAKESPEIYVLESDGYSGLELVMPGSPSSADYHEQLGNVIETLSGVAGIGFAETLAEVHGVGFDVLQNRIPLSASDRGTISLELAQSYINRAKDLLSSTATTEMEPKPYFDRTKKEAKEFSDQCRFAHTFPSSFGFAIECPLPTPTEPMEEVQQTPPFERRVFRRLANGLQAAYEAVEKDDINLIVEHADTALSANSCEIIADLVESTPKRDLTFDFRFSPALKELEITNRRFRLTLSEPHAVAYREAAKRLRNPEISEPAEIHGLITGLSTNANPMDLGDTRTSRSIVVLWSSDKFGDIRVYVTVSAKQYLEALSLHREGKPIRLSGLLTRTGRQWMLAQNWANNIFGLTSDSG